MTIDPTLDLTDTLEPAPSKFCPTEKETEVGRHAIASIRQRFNLGRGAMEDDLVLH